MTKRQENSIEPWRNVDGTLKSDLEIKMASESWTPDIWEQYLLNQVDGDLKESLLTNPESLDDFANEKSTQFWKELSKRKDYKNLGVALCSAIKKLSPRQEEIIIKVYWKGMSLADVSRELGIKRGSVQTFLKRAQIKIGSLLLEEITLKTKQKKKQSSEVA